MRAFLTANVQLFFDVCTMKPPSCSLTFEPLHFGHFTSPFARSPAPPAPSIRALPSSLLSRPAHRPGGSLFYSFAQRGVKDARERQDTRYQYASRHRYESQPERSLPLRRLDTPAVLLRQTTGITTTFCASMSFIRMNRAARLTGSISLSAAFH